MTATVAPRTRPADEPMTEYVGVCASDPERWTTTPDQEAKALCRGCPRRWLCAREGWETPRAEGLWAGVVIPESGRGRDFAFRQLRSLAEFGGYPVRPAHRRRRLGSDYD
jgi:WhiB family redox-sensing transcriptional regulator